MAGTAGNGEVVYTWGAIANADNYVLYISPSSTFVGATPITLSGLTYTKTAATNGVPLYAKIKAVGEDYLDSLFSATLVKTPNLPRLATPANNAAVAGNAQLTQTWDNVANEVSFLVKIATNSGMTANLQTATVAANTLTKVWTGLTNSTTYFVTVTAVGDNTSFIDSLPSATATATPVSGGSTFTAKVGYSATDPYVDNATAPTFTTLRTITPAVGANIVADLHDMPTLSYSVIEYAATETSKANWYDTGLNNGTIPDSAQRAVFTVAGKKYIVARNPITYDSGNTTGVVFS